MSNLLRTVHWADYQDLLDNAFALCQLTDSRLTIGGYPAHFNGQLLHLSCRTCLHSQDLCHLKPPRRFSDICVQYPRIACMGSVVVFRSV